jgi:hypothetical protein
VAAQQGLGILPKRRNQPRHSDPSGTVPNGSFVTNVLPAEK